MEPIESFTIDEGVDINGVRKQVTFEGDKAVTTLTFDAEPIIEAAKEERILTAGERWGEMRKVGKIPLAVLNIIHQNVKGAEERKQAALAWVMRNPKFCTFDKFLK